MGILESKSKEINVFLVQFVAASLAEKEQLMEAAGEDKYAQAVSLVTAWKNFLTVAVKHLPFELTPEQKYFLANDARESLIQELEDMGNMKPIVLLAELCLILATKWGRYKYVPTCPYGLCLQYRIINGTSN
jgi:hypothetical protein